jgi:hypothetical protein
VSQATLTKANVSDNGIRMIVWCLLYAVPLAVALLPLFDEDIWWHLRAGQWLLENRTIPQTDPFSSYGLETARPWIAYSWLFETIVAFFHQAFGNPGIVLFRGLMTLAIVAALHRFVARREPHFARAAGLTGLAVLAMLPLLTERPWLFSILFAILTLEVILDVRAGQLAKWHWLLPIVYVVWANLHIQFVYGLFLLGLACLAPVLERVRHGELPSDHADRAGSPGWGRLVLLTALCTAATLVTPFHIRLYQVVLEYATQRAPHIHVYEMQALEFRKFWDWAVLALAAWAVYALAGKPRVSLFEVLLVVAASWFAFKARRDAWFMALAALAVAVPGAVPGAHSMTGQREFLPSRWQLLGLAAGVASLAAYLWVTRINEPTLHEGLRHHYPVEAVTAIRERGLNGRLYNSYNWGGFLMCNLPELPVCIDGRANLHGDDRLDQSMTTFLGQPGWDQNPDLWAARVILAETKSPLVSLLRLDGRFEKVHEDATATVFVARTKRVATR